jgi:hypothetical protein
MPGIDQPRFFPRPLPRIRIGLFMVVRMLVCFPPRLLRLGMVVSILLGFAR